MSEAGGVAGLPDLLTVEEAARVIRVGRTKAYAMAREWRATDGRSGLPVIDFGHALRVPLCQLERIVGGPITNSWPPDTAETPTKAETQREAETLTTANEAEVAPTSTSDIPTVTPKSNPGPLRPASPSKHRPSRRPGTVPVSQLDLFNAPEAS